MGQLNARWGLKLRKTAKAAPAAPHAGAVKLDPYSFQASHRRLAWLLRISAGTNVVLGAAVTVLVSMFSVLLPLKTTEIALLRADPRDDRLYRVEPLTERVDGFHLLMESMARRYVRLVLEIDSVTQDERHREASRMTDRALSEKFRRERLPAIQEAQASGLQRTIHVISADRVAVVGREYKFAVDLVQIDARGGTEIDRKELRAFLSLTTRPQEVREVDKYTNPLGITVVDMVLRERGN
ncbi:VirB8/TrbF family protein [Telmatospirillum sp. J64-1]|uniref:VirB8/TrbF family protein n=1 Tax=Telmatospirillum sp. J64-1 TaxID=2502183 RepID=UPI00115E7B93|nr:VirB8/TrbF family protein [Telmatospirillum sp. J64-1]